MKVLGKICEYLEKLVKLSLNQGAITLKWYLDAISFVVTLDMLCCTNDEIIEIELFATYLFGIYTRSKVSSPEYNERSTRYNRGFPGCSTEDKSSLSTTLRKMTSISVDFTVPRAILIV